MIFNGNLFVAPFFGHGFAQMDTDYKSMNWAKAWGRDMQIVNHEWHEDPPASPKAKPIGGQAQKI